MLARPNAQLMKTRASATIAPSRTAWARVAMRLGAEGKVSTPATASGIAGRKPASAADGKGTAWPRPTSMTDQIDSPTPQLSADAAKRPHARRIRPVACHDAYPQLAAATMA